MEIVAASMFLSVFSYKSLSSTSRCSWGPKRWGGWPPAWWAAPSPGRSQPRPTPASSWTCLSGVNWGPSGPCVPAGGSGGGTVACWRSPCSDCGSCTPSGGSAGQRCVSRGSGPYHFDLDGTGQREAGGVSDLFTVILVQIVHISVLEGRKWYEKVLTWEWISKSSSEEGRVYTTTEGDKLFVHDITWGFGFVTLENRENLIQMAKKSPIPQSLINIFRSIKRLPQRNCCFQLHFPPENV